MTALGVIRTFMVTVVVVLAVGTTTAGAQTAPALTTDAPQYLPGATVTFTGTGYDGCTDIDVNLFGPDGGPIATGIAPMNGSFTGTFTAGTTVTSYTLEALSNTQQEGCVADVDFDVVAQLPTTMTTTTTTTTAPTSGSSTASSSAAATSSAASSSAQTTALARTGSNPGLLVAAGIAIAIGLVFVAASRRRSVS